jgi:hypothetical protein
VVVLAAGVLCLVATGVVVLVATGVVVLVATGVVVVVSAGVVVLVATFITSAPFMPWHVVPYGAMLFATHELLLATSVILTTQVLKSSTHDS